MSGLYAFAPSQDLKLQLLASTLPELGQCAERTEGELYCNWHGQRVASNCVSECNSSQLRHYTFWVRRRETNYQHNYTLQLLLRSPCRLLAIGKLAIANDGQKKAR